MYQYSYYYYILTDKNSVSTFSCAFVCKSLPCADVVDVGDVGVDGVLCIINLKTNHQHLIVFTLM